MRLLAFLLLLAATAHADSPVADQKTVMDYLVAKVQATCHKPLDNAGGYATAIRTVCIREHHGVRGHDWHDDADALATTWCAGHP